MGLKEIKKGDLIKDTAVVTSITNVYQALFERSYVILHVMRFRDKYIDNIKPNKQHS